MINVSARTPCNVHATLTENLIGLNEMVFEQLREEHYYEINLVYYYISKWRKIATNFTHLTNTRLSGIHNIEFGRVCDFTLAFILTKARVVTSIFHGVQFLQTTSQGCGDQDGTSNFTFLDQSRLKC